MELWILGILEPCNRGILQPLEAWKTLDNCKLAPPEAWKKYVVAGVKLPDEEEDRSDAVAACCQSRHPINALRMGTP